MSFCSDMPRDVHHELSAAAAVLEVYLDLIWQPPSSLSRVHKPSVCLLLVGAHSSVSEGMHRAMSLEGTLSCACTPHNQKIHASCLHEVHQGRERIENINWP